MASTDTGSVGAFHVVCSSFSYPPLAIQKERNHEIRERHENDGEFHLAYFLFRVFRVFRGHSLLLLQVEDIFVVTGRPAHPRGRFLTCPSNCRRIPLPTDLPFNQMTNNLLDSDVGLLNMLRVVARHANGNVC